MGLGKVIRLLLPVDSLTYYMVLHWMLAGGPPGCPFRSSGGASTRPGTSGKPCDRLAQGGTDYRSTSQEGRSDSNRAPLGDNSAKGVDHDLKERA
jgi:hypothetical protein